MKSPELVEAWMRRAVSNLERAKAGKVSNDILYEDLCFDCQQAVEKALKAYLISLLVEFPHTHSIAVLFESIEKTGKYIPEKIKDSIELAYYSVTTRYPGDYEPVEKEEYEEALKVAIEAVDWVRENLKDV